MRTPYSCARHDATQLLLYSDLMNRDHKIGHQPNVLNTYTHDRV